MTTEPSGDPRTDSPTSKTAPQSAPPTLRSQIATVAVALGREEWRVHVRLFGGFRFLAIPLVLGAFAFGTAVALTETGTTTDGVVLGLHVFALGFGLYAGTAGFAGSDMLEDVFGPHSFLLGSAPWLPVSRRLFLGLFLVKDAIFYGLFFVGPMAFAFVGLDGLSASTGGTVLVQWFSLWLAFVLGMAVTVSAISIRTRGVPAWVIALGVGVFLVGTWTSGSLWTTFGRLSATTPSSMLAVGSLSIVVGAVALAVYDPTHVTPARTSPGRYELIRSIVPGRDPLVAKSVLDLGRSSGGYAKPLVSVTILLVLVAGLVGVVESITSVAPAPGLFFGGVLGLSAFTTYNWLTQFDDVDAYRIHPISVDELFRAKRLAFVLIGGPVVAVPYVLAIVWFDATLLDAVVGGAVLAGYAIYYYGLTVALAGFAPNEFLFDGVRFGAFGLGVAIVLVPTLVVSFAFTPLGTTEGIVLVAASVLLAGIGIVLSDWAAGYWTERYLNGTIR
ncbi:hypothetical protein [Halovivax gelatinilyticus]|uniref:hypothetical protein n=1 Tax=Halovivax gelatinilyticus TaxID=2961597 RepID=UPI0020CA7BCB|nr:hypothetical protein [Halovivax gelatinilyticus]